MMKYVLIGSNPHTLPALDVHHSQLILLSLFAGSHSHNMFFFKYVFLNMLNWPLEKYVFFKPPTLITRPL